MSTKEFRDRNESAGVEMKSGSRKLSCAPCKKFQSARSAYRKYAESQRRVAYKIIPEEEMTGRMRNFAPFESTTHRRRQLTKPQSLAQDPSKGVRRRKNDGDWISRVYGIIYRNESRREALFERATVDETFESCARSFRGLTTAQSRRD